MSMKAIVTGGAGFVGANLCNRLVKEGWEVTAIDWMRPPETKARLPFLKDVHLIEADIRTVNLDLRDIDIIYHIGGQVSHVDSMYNAYEDLDINGGGVLNLLKQVQNNPHVKFVYASSRSVYGPQPRLPIDETAIPGPIDPYGATKLLAEYYVRIWARHYGIPYTIYRMANVFGPMQRLGDNVYQVVAWFFRNVMLNEPISYWGDPDTNKRDFLYVDDACDAYLKAAKSDVKGTYNLPGKTYCSWSQMFEIAFDTFKRKVPVSKTAYPSKIELMLNNPQSQLDGSRAHAFLDWLPKTSLREGFEVMKDWYMTDERWRLFVRERLPQAVTVRQ